MGGTQDNGTICLAADGTVSHCRDGDGGYAVIDDNAQDTFNVLMYHTFFNQTNSQIGFERASNTLANADGQLSGWTFRGCPEPTAITASAALTMCCSTRLWNRDQAIRSIPSTSERIACIARPIVAI